MMINNVQKLLDSVPLFVQGYDSLVSVNEILFESDIEHNGTKLPDTVQGGIEFRHVSFGYDSEKDSVLRDISFSIPAGRSIAIAGRSGQGKSTVMNLISERRVQEAINAMIGSCTVVMAAHRLGTLRCADDIYLMNNGRLEKCGSFEELTEFMGAGD